MCSPVQLDCMVCQLGRVVCGLPVLDNSEVFEEIFDLLTEVVIHPFRVIIFISIDVNI
jgi:hypothetical protein